MMMNKSGNSTANPSLHLQRDGDNLVCRVELELTDVLFGKKVELAHLSGETLAVELAAMEMLLKPASLLEKSIRTLK